MCNDPVSFKGDMQRLTAQSNVEDEFVAGVFWRESQSFCQKVATEPGAKEDFKCATGPHCV